MKRSSSIVLTGLIAGSGISLTACDGDVGGKPVDAQSYASVAECRSAGAISSSRARFSGRWTMVSFLGLSRRDLSAQSDRKNGRSEVKVSGGPACDAGATAPAW